MRRITTFIIVFIACIVLILAISAIIMKHIERRNYREETFQRVYINIYASEDLTSPTWDAFFGLGDRRTVLDVMKYASRSDNGGSETLQMHIDYHSEPYTITGILGLDNTQSHEWVCFLNGKECLQSVQEQVLSPNDIVEWWYMNR